MENNAIPDLSKRILEKIPAEIKPAEYLTDILGISKESAYRRLKGTIPFTFGEALHLATKLDFSMDEIFKGNKDEHAILSCYNNRLTDDDGFLQMFRLHYYNQEAIYKAKQNQITISTNCILAIFTCAFENLFKFSYYKWLHRFKSMPLNFSLSDLVIPDELKILREKVIDYSGDLNVTLITDKNIFRNTIQEVKYYKDRGLINNEEIQLIKDELKDFIEGFYLFSSKKTFGDNARSEAYLCSLNIENNTSYVVFDNKISSYYWTYSDCCIHTSDPHLCALEKDWMDSLKKYSTLISNSNQKMQAELYNQLLEQLDILTT